MTLLKSTYKSLRTELFYIRNHMILRNSAVSFKKDFKIQGKIIVQNSGLFSIGDKFRCNSGQVYNPIGGDSSCQFIIRENAVLSIGSNVGISNSTFVATTEIVIEDDVRIGGSCKIWDTDFHSLDPHIRIKEHDKIVNSKPIRIGKGAFIGADTIILKGVTLGENAVIGAGSVVSKDIPANEIWAGNPVRFIKKVDLSDES